MQKFLRTMMLLAALALPFASNAQVTADRTYLSQDFSVANPEGWTGGSSAYAPTFAPTGAPSWTYTEYDLNGLAAGHYYYNLYAKDRYQWLVSPEMDLTESGQAQLRFDIALTAFSGTGAPADVDSGKTVMVLVRTKANTPGAAWGSWQTLRKWVKTPAEGELDIMSLTAAYTHDTADFAEYLGKYAQIAFYCENTTLRLTSVNIHVDNVVVDGKIRAQAPTEITLGEIGSTTAALSWVDTLNPVVDHYEVMAVHGEDTVYAVSNGDEASAIVNGLAPATSYTFYVRTYIDANTWSVWSAVSVSGFTHFANPLTGDFAFDFEEGAEGWQFVNDANNGWYYGTEVLAAHLDTLTADAYAAGCFILPEDTVFNGEDIDTAATTWSYTVQVNDSVNHVLWISNDGGVTNAYTLSGAQVSYAYLPVQLEAGDYDFGYNWRSRGETGNYDYLRVMLVEESTELTAGTMITNAPLMSDYHKNQANWQDVSNVVTIGSDGIYKLVLMWRNDNSTGNQPPASVDNIFLTRVICFPVAELAQEAEGTTFGAIAMSWVDTINEEASYRIVAIGGGDTIEAVVEAPEMPYVLTHDSIKAETTYQVSVYTICGANVESHPAVANMTTNRLCEPVTNLAAETTRGAATITWVDTRNVNATYDVIVKLGDDTIANVEGAENGVVVNGLTATTTYQMNVIAHANDTFAVANANFVTMSLDGSFCGEVTLISDISKSNSYIPTYCYYNYSLSHVLITAEEMAAAGAMAGNYESISFNAAGTMSRNVAIYIQHTDLTTLPTGTNSNIPVAEGSKVYEGTFATVNGWFTINFDTPFTYDGESGILITVDDNTGSYVSSVSFRGQTAPGMGTSIYSDPTNYNPSTAAYSMSARNFRPAMRLSIACAQADELVAVVADRTSSGATFTWNNPMATLEEDATEYHVVVKAGNETVVNETVADTTTFTTDELNPSTNYTVEVSAVYEDGYTISGEPVAFETRGPCNAPENFTAVATRASISLSWTQDDPTIESYQLYYTTDANADLADLEETDFITVSGNEGYTIQNLDAGTTYYIYFRSNCGDNQSAWRDATVATVPLVDCDAPKIDVVIAEGTATNEDIPFYGYWLDSYSQHTQSIYPASMLTNLVGKTITSVTYTSTGTTSKTMSGASSTYKMTITDQSDLSAGFVDMTNVPVLYTGSFVASSGKVTIIFDEPFVYTGGNLLVEMNAANNAYASMTFKGVEATNASRFEGYSSHEGIKNFLAQLTFATCAEGAACAAVEEITVSDIDYNTATLSWERPDCKVNGYLLVVSDTAVADFSAVQAETLGDINNYVFENLDQNANHYVYLATLCGEGENADTSAWASAEFYTPAYCRVATNVAAELNAKNAALLTWESTDSTQAANFSVILDTVALSEDSLTNYPASAIYATGIEANELQLIDLEYNTKYYAYVRNVCQLGEADAPAPWVGPATFTTIEEMTDVKNLTAEVYRNEVTATWEADSANFATDSLWIVAIVGHDSVPTTWSTVNTPTYTWTGLEWDTVYDVYVAAFNGTLTSDTVMATATIGIGMPVVLNLATSVYRNEITATWEIDPNGLDTAWAVAVRKVNDSSDLVWVNVDTTVHTFIGLQYDTLYNVYVKALYLDMESDSVVKTNVHTHIAMPNVTGIYVNPLSHNFAQVNWQRGNSEAVETEWAFAIKAASDTNDFVYTTIDHMDTMIYGLDELTTYQVKIAALWNGMSSDTVAYSFTTPSKASALSACLNVAEGTNTNSYLPSYSLYNYSLSHTIVLAEELPGAKPLSSIAYNVSGAKTRNITIYLMPTTLSSFSSTTSMPLSSDAVMVYQGEFGSHTGWNVLEFSEPYQYDGTSNLIVVVDDNTGTWSSGLGCYGTSTTGVNMGMSIYSDPTNYDPHTSYSMSNRNFRPLMQFCYEGQYIQDLTVENITETSADVSWMPGGHETEWEYVNVEGEMTNAELEAAEKVVVTEQNAALTGLTADKDYTFYVRAHEVIDSTLEVVYVFDSIHTWYDTTYSKENPLEMVVITHNDSIMKVAYDTACVYSVDTAAVLPTGKIAIDTIMSVVDPTVDSLYVYNDTTCTYSIVYDTLLNQDWYSDWGHVAYTTEKTCDVPLAVNGYAYEAADSAMLIAFTEAEALNFRYAVKGSDEYITVAGIADTVVDTIATYATTCAYAPGETSPWECVDLPLDQIADFIAYYEPYGYEVVVDTIPETYDTTAYFYAEIGGLTSNTTYVVSAQNVCGEGNSSRWLADVEFSTPYNCGDGVDLPYTENFDGINDAMECWNVVMGENEPVFDSLDTLEYEISYYSSQYRLFPASSMGDHEYIPNPDSAQRYNRYVISPVINGTEETSLYWTSSMMVNTYYVNDNDYSDDSVAFGYSTTNDSIESFTWTELRSNAGSYNSNWTNVEALPAGVKYIAYHFVGSKPDWMALNSTTIRALNQYNVVAVNSNPDAGDVLFIADGDTLEVAAQYNEDVDETQTPRVVAQAAHGYRFINWETIDGNNHRTAISTSTSITCNQDTLVIANFAINENTVQVNMSNNALGTAKITVPADTNKFKAAHGTEFTLTAVDTVENDNIIFRGWSLTNNANNIVSYENPYTFNLDAATNNATQTYTAMFVQDSFNVAVNYNVEMGTVTAKGKTIVDSSVNLALADTGAITMVATINHGYEFINWTDANGAVITTELTFDTVSHNGVNLVFNANMQTVPYYVQVASNDETKGTATVDTNAAQYLDTVIFTATPVAEHYHFQFWRGDNGEEYTENPLEHVIVNDINMIAFFVIDTHMVKVVSDEENYGYVTINGEQVDSMYFDYGTAGVVIEAVPNTGVEFTQWSDGYLGNPRTIGALEFDTIFTAEFDSIDYTIAVNVNETEGSVEAIDGTTAKYLDTLTFVATANAGYRFVAWHDAAENTYYGDTLRYTVTAEEEQAITAEYTEAGKVNVNLVANIIEAGTVTAYGQSTIEGVAIDTNSADGYIRFDSLSTVTIVAVPAEHYHFLRWEGADEFVSENDTVEVDSISGDALTFTAYFEIDTHMIAGIAEHGSFTINGLPADTMYVNYGTSVNIAPVADNHFHFVAWADSTADTVRTIEVLNDTVVEAIFAIDTHAVTPAVNDTNFGTVEVTEGYMSEVEGTYWFNYGDTAWMTAAPEYGYHFVDWSTGSTEAETYLVVYGTNTITANFDTNVYNVTFVAENGSIEGPATIKHFTTANYVAVPAYGYHFDSWTNELSETDTAELSAISDTTIEAIFAKNSYVVTGVANYDSLGTVAGTDTVLYQDTVTLIATAIEGYHVENWSNGMTGDTIEVVADSNITVTANFAINVYTVTAAANFADRGTVTGAAETEHGANDTLVATANNGYHFDGWSNGVTTDTMVLTVVSDTTVTANFAKNAYAATVNCDTTMGTATVSAAAPLYLDTVVFTATPNEHYRFVNWSNGLTDASINVVITSDTALTANFEAIMWTVTVSSAADSMGSVTPAGDSLVMDGSSFTATAIANDGFRFVSWNTGDTTETITVTVDTNMSLVASFEVYNVEPVIPQFTVILTSANSAMGTVSAGATVDSGTVFTATATPADGHSFVAWVKGTDTVSTTAVYTFTVTEDISLVAYFAADSTPVATYTVTADVMGQGTVTGAGSYEEGAECVLVAHAATGYRFVEWRNGDQVLGTDTILTFTVTANITITAVFEQDGIDDVDMNNVNIYSADSKVIVRGAENQSIYVFDVNGRVIASETNAAETCEFRMASTGVYLVKVGNAPAKRVLVVR